jgi:hypothetical protein
MSRRKIAEIVIAAIAAIAAAARSILKIIEYIGKLRNTPMTGAA